MKTMRGQSLAQCLIVAALMVAASVGLRQVFAQEPAAGNPPAIYEGNTAAGKAVFDAPGSCNSCHRAGGAGAFYGPNLSNVGSRISPAGFRILLNTPPEKVKPENRLYEVVLRDGKTVSGKLLNQDPFSVQLLDLEGKLVAYQRAQIRSSRFTDPPQMPSYKSKLTDKQIADLVAYLTSLRTPEN
jgi:putative heme-binding domain-containing protein